ncbi:hypothetical protein KI809_10900 [Geobacter pelophilus]|uniref:Doubled CXXCH motif domain-containing protein n=1 Tax=Geoanaerobacter pelophilus TaxID=60036 RepID=A0AAW4L6Z1_9BACT|nr:hypothetical protein [Geoanaerobacter pelophilus]MBT0664808.1 hypothetical protein [Geoanaerobacter pelophilus]
MINRFTPIYLYSLSVFFVGFLAAIPHSFAEDCLDCHSDVSARMSGGSHHVQQTGVKPIHCYACHWEARPDGSVDKQYHSGTAQNSAVDLVVWGAGQRPTEYNKGVTAIIYSPSELATAQERSAVGSITVHCLGCHSDSNNSIQPFSGDPNSPSRYAWDGQSVAARYAAKGTTTWGKYSTSASNKKMRITKAFSAHGNASANQGGWSSASGYDGEIPITRGGPSAGNIECFDCHNSHGSDITGVTSSYRNFDGTNRGGILKQTNSGKSGYRMNYVPSANLDQKSSNPYNPGAGLCFDCHETAQSGATPWGYNSTFGAKGPIIGYKDTSHFGTGVKGSTSRYTNRQSRTEIISSHLKAGKFLSYSTQGRINGLCTPCHDPHGVSPILGARMAYAVPLLKGTWLTSPYREDGPPSASPGKAGFEKRDGTGNRAIAWEKGDFSFTNRDANANFGIGGSGAPREPMSMAGMKYNIDRNTFGADKRIAENEDVFAGLCLSCHIKEKNGKATEIHRSVKGWGSNKEHAFPCSKCHQPHNSGLPRLMQTNCFEEGPSGLRENSGLSWLPKKKSDVASDKNAKPAASQGDASNSKKTGKVEVVGCHVKQFGRGNTPSQSRQDGSQWNQKSSW